MFPTFPSPRGRFGSGFLFSSYKKLTAQLRKKFFLTKPQIKTGKSKEFPYSFARRCFWINARHEIRYHQFVLN